MQVYPEPSGSGAVALASSSAAYAVGKPVAVLFASQLSEYPPPPAYTPPVYQSPANAYGFNPNFDPAPSRYGAPESYGVTPTSYGYPVGQAAPQTQLQNVRNVQVGIVNVTASPSAIVAQPAPVVMSPPSYLGWSIFNFLCCFWPLGLAAIMYSVKVGSARNNEEAKSYSLTARNLNIAASAIAPILAVVVIGAWLGSVGTVASGGLYNPRNYDTTTEYIYMYSSYYYYTYLTYYSYSEAYNNYTYFVSFNYDIGAYYSYGYTVTGYRSVIVSEYALGFYYQYAQGHG